MSQQKPNSEILEGQAATPAQERIVALFDKLEAEQLGFWYEAAKRIIELSTLLLGVLFGFTAFGDKFPPPYLVSNAWAKAGVIATLAFYLCATLVALVAAQPREYPRYDYNLSEMRRVLAEIRRYKSRRVKLAAALFALGSLSLALLIGAIVLVA